MCKEVEKKLNKIIKLKVNPMADDLKDFKKKFINNFYVAGGAIVSTFQGEKVNDIDLFCKDETILREFITIILTKATNRLNSIACGSIIFSYKFLYNECPEEYLESGYSLIGTNNFGFLIEADFKETPINNVESKLLDNVKECIGKNINFLKLEKAIRNYTAYSGVVANVKKTSLDIYRVSPFAITFRGTDVQVIISGADVQEDKVASFDFKHCMMWRNLNSKEIFYTDDAISLAKNKILIANLENRIDRIAKGEFTFRERFDRFLKRGYVFSKEEHDRCNEFVYKFGFDDIYDCLYIPKSNLNNIMEVLSK